MFKALLIIISIAQSYQIEVSTGKYCDGIKAFCPQTYGCSMEACQPTPGSPCRGPGKIYQFDCRSTSVPGMMCSSNFLCTLRNIPFGATCGENMICKTGLVCYSTSGVIPAMASSAICTTQIGSPCSSNTECSTSIAVSGMSCVKGVCAVCSNCR